MHGRNPPKNTEPTLSSTDDFSDTSTNMEQSSSDDAGSVATLAFHQCVHVPSEVRHYGPVVNTSTAIFEHAQSELAKTARNNTIDSEEYGFKLYTAWTISKLAEIQHQTDSDTVKQLRHATGNAVHSWQRSCDVRLE